MSATPSYEVPVAVDAVVEGWTVAQDVASHLDGFAAGHWVLCHNGWQDYAMLELCPKA